MPTSPPERPSPKQTVWDVDGPGVSTFINLQTNPSQYKMIGLDFWSYKQTCRELVAQRALRPTRPLQFLHCPAPGAFETIISIILLCTSLSLSDLPDADAIKEKTFYQLVELVISRMRAGEVIYLHADQDSPVLPLVCAFLLSTQSFPADDPPFFCSLLPLISSSLQRQ